MKAVIEESARHLRQRFRLRSLEWEHACISLVFGGILLFNPSLMDAESFSGFLGGSVVWGIGVLVLGCVNVAALIVNGTVPKPTAALRFVSALLQVFLFLMLSIGFLASGTGTTGIGTYCVLAIFGFFAAAWALLDAVAPEYDQ
ncbi:hypothetical protein GCM10007989_24540 [Devosia pacifica]|uniref:Uncharacterized protein n=1 Tax=Devosia pacifica TaxID=1335967 RepID=A0A918S7X3_9HYPH|nr:hypothetical protein [Devosia pacifica]GHA27745.1 hypothetical protein GCM10007989_24540 [Devosia pacifica]